MSAGDHHLNAREAGQGREQQHRRDLSQHRPGPPKPGANQRDQQQREGRELGDIADLRDGPSQPEPRVGRLPEQPVQVGHGSGHRFILSTGRGVESHGSAVRDPAGDLEELAHTKRDGRPVDQVSHGGTSNPGSAEHLGTPLVWTKERTGWGEPARPP